MIPDDFKFQTTALRQVDYNFGTNFSLIPIAIYGSVYETFTEDQPIKDSFVGFAMTDINGNLSAQVMIPLSCTYLVLKPGYIGLPEEIRTALTTNSLISKSVTARSLGTEYTFIDDLPTRIVEPRIKQSDLYWWFVNDKYPSYGIPESLFSISLEQDFLKDLNSLFKWNRGIYDNVPQEILDGRDVGTLDMSADNDVWMTFIDEKAGFYNTLGYYTYPTANTPTSIDDDDITLVFPNASYGSENKQYLESGDTVYIGKIPKDYSLGFVLIANGWSSASAQVRKEGQGIYYSQKELNPESEDYASLMYYGDKVFLVGMEDNRHTDTDYNFRDVIFAVVVGDETLVKNKKDPIAVTSDSDLDGDGDGVIDVLDAYPDDSSRTTKETLSGTIAYEDLWPKLGDYDFNDLVIGYEYTIDGNNENKIVSMNMQYTLKASGAGYPNGLALALPLKTDDFTLGDIAYSDSTIDPEDTDLTVISEGEDSKRSQILIFRKQKSVMSEKTFNIDDTTYPRLVPQSVSFTLTFKPAISRDTLGEVPYDVFLMVDNAESDTDEKKWGREVHLLGYGPTSLANKTFLDEATALNNKDYYKSENNLPWAIHIPGDWAHPLERKSIVDAYTYFGAWAESGGTSYPDWYLDKPNYRNNANLY